MNSNNPNNAPDNDLIPDDKMDELDDNGEIEERAAFDGILEIGIPISETLGNSSVETSEPPQLTEFPGRNIATMPNGEPHSEVDCLKLDCLKVPDTSHPPSDSFSDHDDSQQLPVDDSCQALGHDLLETIKLQIDDLARAFDSKLKYDEHKNKIIDDLHQSLQQHREGLLKKYLHRIVMDVIKIVDDMRKLTAHYNHLSHSEETSVKLLKYIENIATDLEDMFSWEGVVPFTCEGDVIDLARQRVLNKIETDDPEKDKTIAQRLRPGYEWDGKIIRPEMVSAYIYQTNSPSGDLNNS